MTPVEVTVSEGAMSGGAVKVSEQAAAAIAAAQAEAQRAMQATMAEVQQGLMARLQAKS